METVAAMEQRIKADMARALRVASRKYAGNGVYTGTGARFTTKSGHGGDHND
jgi:hypothetical protein